MKTKIRLFKNLNKEWVGVIYKGDRKNRKLIIKKKSKNIFKVLKIFNLKNLKESFKNKL